MEVQTMRTISTRWSIEHLSSAVLALLMMRITSKRQLIKCISVVLAMLIMFAGAAAGPAHAAPGDVVPAISSAGISQAKEFRFSPSADPLPDDVVVGAIRAKWLALGGPYGLLGRPLTPELSTPDGIGRYNHFQGGSIYWTPATGAHEVHGE
jgi:hypothetical protein